MRKPAESYVKAYVDYRQTLSPIGHVLEEIFLYIEDLFDDIPDYEELGTGD